MTVEIAANYSSSPRVKMSELGMSKKLSVKKPKISYRNKSGHTIKVRWVEELHVYAP